MITKAEGNLRFLIKRRYTMKKLLTTLLAAAMLAATTLCPVTAEPAKSEQTLATWDFETQDEVNLWTRIDSDGDGFNWSWNGEIENDDLYAFSGDYFMFSESYDWSAHSPLEPDNCLISPEINVPEGVDRAWVNFLYNGYEYSSDFLAVYVSTDGGETWGDEVMSSVSMGTYVDFDIELTEYAGQTVKIMFRHFNCRDGYSIGIDFVTFNVDGEVAPIVPGDVDGNGVVNATDALHVLRHAMGITLLEGDALAAGDFNSDNVVDGIDAVLILRTSMNLS